MRKQTRLYDGDTFIHDGLQFVVSIEHDQDHGAPWDEEEGHGPVSDWARRDKKPGEWLLRSDGYHHRFYDAAEATRIAKRDGWGIASERVAELAAKLGRTPTKGEITAEAVRRDFEYLRGWANDEWHYVGVCVRHVKQDENEKYSYALWGIESDADDYLTEVAYQLAEECAADIRAEIEKSKERFTFYTDKARELIDDVRQSGKLRMEICAAVKDRLALCLRERRECRARIAELTA